MSFQGPNYGITNFDNFLHSMLTVFQVYKILQVATKSNRNLSLKNKFAVCNIGGLDWDLVLGEFRFTSASSSTPALLAFFEPRAPFFFFQFFVFLFLFVFLPWAFCPVVRCRTRAGLRGLGSTSAPSSSSAPSLSWTSSSAHSVGKTEPRVFQLALWWE